MSLLILCKRGCQFPPNNNQVHYVNLDSNDFSNYPINNHYLYFTLWYLYPSHNHPNSCLLSPIFKINPKYQWKHSIIFNRSNGFKGGAIRHPTSQLQTHRTRNKRLLNKTLPRSNNILHHDRLLNLGLFLLHQLDSKQHPPLHPLHHPHINSHHKQRPRHMGRSNRSRRLLLQMVPSWQNRIFQPTIR